MFLNRLSYEKKELFLSLAQIFSKSDGDYSDDERILLEQYCNEMDINIELITLNEDISYVTKTLSEICDVQDKKIIIFEIMGLILADGVYHNEENKLLIQVIENFGLDKKYCEDCRNLINEYYDLQNRILNLVR